MESILTSFRFLLVVVQLQNILDEPTAGDIEDALDNLSRDLPEAFKDTINRIHRLSPSRVRLGMDTLMWISHAERGLTVFELGEILSVRPGRSNFSPRHVPSAKEIVECSQGLVWVNPKTHEVTFIHSTIQEFLKKNASQFFPKADADLGASCLRYLMLKEFGDGPRADGLSIISLLVKYQFLPYAASYWGATRPEVGDQARIPISR